ncbi:hypothetical protein SFRURICE_011449 [Spodoptera frugiperda]|nr:hypothetical protein SFRURICE_013633 [Spodoptera frugiperda]KAF9806745.1 hypothetical protein SFRURICE_011449 [Spodoptera frugiperda]
MYKNCCFMVSAHKHASYASYALHVGIADDAVRTMRISGRSCISFYEYVRCVRCGSVDAYL